MWVSFLVLMKTSINHYNDILNYFDQRSTNGSAESFNAKIKNFRLQIEGYKTKCFSFSDYPKFLLSPQVLLLILYFPFSIFSDFRSQKKPIKIN
ncbi:transposase [Chryseobacterium sp. MDT2-18]|uniref:transposase n=1 Tax=Chryseobacterium sp. MDT2-18 TaxID=1259136 RepID=UPI0027D84AA8|nr:transposase [Chryseobacterium sp. MDT2-18]